MNVDSMVEFLQGYWQEWADQCELPDNLVPDNVPPPLAKIYKHLGGMLDVQCGMQSWQGSPFSSQDHLSKPGQLLWVDGLLEFAFENQGNWSARCKWDEDDPVVLCNVADLWNDTPKGFQPVCDSLEHFLITLSLQEALMSSRWAAATDRSLEELGASLEPLWLDGWYVFNEPSHSFYTAKEGSILVMNEFTSGVWLGSMKCEQLLGKKK